MWMPWKQIIYMKNSLGILLIEYTILLRKVCVFQGAKCYVYSVYIISFGLKN